MNLPSAQAPSVHAYPAGRPPYRGRLAPSPTGLLHLGHARTFLVAWERARRAGGELLLRNDDLDAARFRGEFVDAMQEDLRWLGLDWDGPMVSQSGRIPRYRAALKRLHAAGLVYACTRSRRDVLEAAGAPHDEEEPVYPREFRPPAGAPQPPPETPGVNWRLRVPDGEEIAFVDGLLGRRAAVAGRDFGDFVVWRRDGVPSYQLACAVDDGEMSITEVVRGDDLVVSTFRQILVLRALGFPTPAYLHCPLMADDSGKRLAKRHDALSLRSMRARGDSPSSLRAAAALPPEPNRLP